MKNKALIALIFAATHVQAGEYTLKNRSAFSTGDSVHNPFCPIGWTKTVVASTGQETTTAALLKAEDFNVSSILLNNPPLALINGKAMAEGEVFRMQIGTQQVLVQLASVQDGQVVLRYQGQDLIVPLHRRGDAPRTALR
ncbi:MAG: hypothetical protein QOD99_1480 [Chthoniobacter sp.]|jgi:hypothetical protein|nr:hypothetical protein [Chthoniobacter sp.]